jgi:hypothetical protein
MLDSITPEMFDEWMAYYTIEPFGDEWERSAMICATVFNTKVTKKHDLAKIDDYMPTFSVNEKPKRPNQKMKPDEALKYFAANYGVK